MEKDAGETPRKVGNRLYWKDKCYRARMSGKGLVAAVYWSCADRQCKARIVESPLDTFKAKYLEHSCTNQETEIAKENANKRLKELTLSAQNGDKAIDIVRKFLNELAPEVMEVMPNECALLKRVRRYAAKSEVALGRSTFGDYLAEVGLDSSLASTSAQESSSHCSEPGRDETIADSVGEGRRSCSKHDAPERKRKPLHNLESKMPPSKTLKLVDEEGRDLGNVPLDKILTAGEDSSKFCLDYDNLPRVSSASIPQDNTSSGTGKEGMPTDSQRDFAVDFGDDDNRCNSESDCEPELSPAPHKTIKSRTVSTSSKVKGEKATQRYAKETMKSGEKCLVCGDALLVSETLSSSEETFLKACCYLNVKSENEWFPRKSNGQFYSFCESCTNEIIRIHQLYKKVEEHQSLIFQKVEQVEKRIADAEIVDNWLADASASSALRFEGFRKQVLINYKNKLKLRREIRVGTKMGHQFTEIQPITSAHMFASDPAETEAFRKIATNVTNGADSINEIPFLKRKFPNAKRSRGRPKSKRIAEPLYVKSELNSHDLPFEEAASTASNDKDGDEAPHDDDAMSVRSEKEMKFWEADPSRLNVCNENDDSHEGDNRDTGDVDWMGAADGSDSDTNASDDNDDDWGTLKSRRSKRATRKGTLRPTPKLDATGSPEGKPKRKSHRGRFELPDAVLTPQGRLFLSGIEIIKNAPGSYKRCPQSVSFTCSACGKIILSFHGMKTHVCGHHLGMFNCPTCLKHITQLKSLERHIKEKHSENSTPTPCTICGRPIGDRYMRYHQWSHLSEEEKNDPRYQNYIPIAKRDPNRIKYNYGLQTFMCTFCSKTFHRITALRSHELMHGQTFQCQFCGKIYKDKKILNRHSRKCGQTPEEKAKESLYTYPCPKCPVRLKTRQIQALHIRRFHSEPPSLTFACPNLKCPRRFSSRNGMKKHKLVCVEGQSRGASKKGRSWNHSAGSFQSSTSSSESHFITKFENGIMTPSDMTLEHQSIHNNSSTASNSSTATNANNANPSSLFSGFSNNQFGNSTYGSVFQSQQSHGQQ